MSGSAAGVSKKNQSLNCDVEGEQLVIRIGVSTLAWAAKKRNGGPMPHGYRMLDEHQWARDVANRLMHEDEIGYTMLGDVLDKAMQQAMDCGSTGLSYAKPPNDQAQRPGHRDVEQT